MLTLYFPKQTVVCASVARCIVATAEYCLGRDRLKSKHGAMAERFILSQLKGTGDDDPPDIEQCS
jgi:hypothetical protein